MNRGLLIGVAVVALVLIGGGIWYMNSKSGATPATSTPAANDRMAVPTTVENSASPAATTETPSTGKVVEFTVESSGFKFVPAVLKVKKGDTVRINFKNTGGIHDLVIDEFDVATNQINDGEEEEVEFVADKVGSFEYYCSVGTHRQMGMKGTLVVE